MKNKCLNCNHTTTGNFCSNCGQKKYRRIDKKYIGEELGYMIFHANKGFFYSIKCIIKNPGKTAKEFIDGKRVNHYKPLLLTFVLNGILAFISFKLIGIENTLNDYYRVHNISSEFTNDFIAFFSGYNALIMTLLIPISAFVTKIIFRKWGHNYYEHIVANSYILSLYILINIALSPLTYIFRDNIDVTIKLSWLTVLILPLIFIWFFKEFYKDKPIKIIVRKVLISIVLIILAVFVFCTILAILFLVTVI